MKSQNLLPFQFSVYYGVFLIGWEENWAGSAKKNSESGNWRSASKGFKKIF